MGTSYGIILFHEEMRRSVEATSSWKEAFNLNEVPSRVTRKPSLAEIRQAFLDCYADSLGPIGVMSFSSNDLGVVQGSENVEEALAIANGTVGWVNRFAPTLERAIFVLISEYLDAKDADHPNCYLGMSPVGCLRISRVGTAFAVKSNVYGVYSYKSDPDQVRFEQVLLSAHFRPTDQKGSWEATLSRDALLDLVSNKFKEMAFASPTYYETHPEHSGIEITLMPPDLG